MLSKLSAPLAWGVSLLIDRVLRFAWDKLMIGIERAKVFFHLKKELKIDKKNAGTYRETLKDGAKENDQIKASLDMLNHRDPDRR